ncbi:MAG: Ribosomal large subunit pseudouridine synthase B [Phycisphaerae bacterium]|nr:Ribosomal large subunit pseudouridine synthase B [Phycisphaerae bacterium]
MGRRLGPPGAVQQVSDGLQRIQKVLAAAGYGSRRACEELVCEGRVKVNGQVVNQLPVLVNPQQDDIRVDGRRVRIERLVYYLLHKPRGVICTNADPQGRMRAIDLLTGVHERVYPVGRLDSDSTGLVLLTNDGALAERLTHPRYGVEKIYHVQIKGRLSAQDLERLKKGVWLADGRSGPVRVTIRHQNDRQSVLEVHIREGRNRQVRRMLLALGHEVRSLKRIKLGTLSLRGLGLGKFRPLTSTEVQALSRLSQQSSAAPRRAAGSRSTTSRPPRARQPSSARPTARRRPRTRP